MTIKKVTMLYGKLNEHKDISHYDYFSKSEVKKYSYSEQELR